MPCGSCGGGTANRASQQTRTFVVSLANGTSKEVSSEFEARVEITKAGGGTYRPKA